MLSIDLDPKKWKDYFHNEHQVQRLQKAVLTNKHAPAYTFSGKSGSGKTALAKLYIQSTLCLNRPVDSVDPCGHCKVCKSDPRTIGPSGGVTWVQQGSQDTINSRVNAAIEEAYQPTYGVQEDHRDWKFIVVDELQSVNKALLQKLLFLPELPEIQEKNKVIFIFITMNEDAIDPTVMGPLADRSVYFRFKGFSTEQTVNFLKVLRPEAPLESLGIIAAVSKGSLRSALANLDKCEQFDSSLTTISVADIMYYADVPTRAKLWSLIQSNGPESFNNLRLFWELLETKVDSTELIRVLSRDVENEMARNYNEELWVASKIMFNYLTSGATVRPFDLIKMLMRRQLLNPKFLVCEGVSGYEAVFGEPTN